MSKDIAVQAYMWTPVTLKAVDREHFGVAQYYRADDVDTQWGRLQSAHDWQYDLAGTLLRECERLQQELEKAQDVITEANRALYGAFDEDQGAAYDRAHRILDGYECTKDTVASKDCEVCLGDCAGANPQPIFCPNQK